MVVVALTVAAVLVLLLMLVTLLLVVVAVVEAAVLSLLHRFYCVCCSPEIFVAPCVVNSGGVTLASLELHGRTLST